MFRSTAVRFSAPGNLKIFSDAKSAKFLAAAAKAASLPSFENNPPEIGRANVGKSTLLNAVLGRNGLVHTSKQAGCTRTLNFYGVGPQPHKLVLVDAPGYGGRGRPEWGAVFNHYTKHRKKLKRIYILINSSHGVKEVDWVMLETLNRLCEESMQTERPITLQAILTKADTISTSSKGIPQLQQEIFEAAPLCLPAVVTSVSKKMELGVGETRRSILEACGLGRVDSKVIHS
ncbi:hypothetical protein PHLGIDRAFT_71062 [Phlebiopsis gigantea 11061_1 CR5-6]|uniref:EngB-type G domain-containing protein n=1 Tax=Phlebiopsis gigantea (strain 11061_1 CR5-6) TaxID=745531 RepID=A0A0C3NQL6_PHLG1|nr:hypothetical protein PHLGIDRAFT_71062 [Phlebiopsis gigantea 11061_1 CR5-6]